MQITQQEYTLLMELVQELDYPPLDPARHVTASMLGEQLGITHRAARDKLDRMRANGELGRERIRLPDNCRWAWGYYKK